MTGCGITSDMTDEENGMNDGAPEEDDDDTLYFYWYFDDNYYDGADDIGKLGYLACRGSRSAAAYLRKHYSEGPSQDPGMAYKYTCYAALAGDEESIRILRSEGKLVSTFFIEDFEPGAWMNHPIDPTRPCEDRGYIVFYPVRPEVRFNQGDPALNIGYRHPDSFGEYEYLGIDFIRPEDLPDGDLPSDERYMFSSRRWPSYWEMDQWIAGEPYDDEYDDIDARFFRDVFQYFGIGMDRDEDAAIRDLLEMAMEDNRNAADMIAYAIGYEPETFLARYSDRTAEAEAELATVSEEEFPRGRYYSVADRGMLHRAPEWHILMMLTHLDPWGFSYDEAHNNSEGGYEDDVMFTRADNQYAPGPPTFIFKPSGYSMGWYKYCWRSPEQNENLSMGEIRRVFRLCVEHIAYGREVPYGPTKELIAVPMHLYEPPEDIREDLEEVARYAISNRVGWVGSSWPKTFCSRDAGSAEELALEILSDLGVEHDRAYEERSGLVFPSHTS